MRMHQVESFNLTPYTAQRMLASMAA